MGPGAIEFKRGLAPGFPPNSHSFFPKEGDLYIFPATLEHWVFPFQSDMERVSVSGNLHEPTKRGTKK